MHKNDQGIRGYKLFFAHSLSPFLKRQLSFRYSYWKYRYYSNMITNILRIKENLQKKTVDGSQWMVNGAYELKMTIGFSINRFFLPFSKTMIG
ncbi:MAG: hypothetical protein ACI9XO_002489 [Paraglaciecola sp.]|jgi:hypothetical protein